MSCAGVKLGEIVTLERLEKTGPALSRRAKRPSDTHGVTKAEAFAPRTHSALGIRAAKGVKEWLRRARRTHHSNCGKRTLLQREAKSPAPWRIARPIARSALKAFTADRPGEASEQLSVRHAREIKTDERSPSHAGWTGRSPSDSS